MRQSGRYLEPATPSDDSQPLFADNPLTLLWQNAPDRETGAEAVKAIRARRRDVEPSAEKQDASRRRFRRRRAKSDSTAGEPGLSDRAT